MSLETKSKELKDIISTYDTQWFLGDLSGLFQHISKGTADDQLGELSSPMRQLYFLGGLLLTTDNADGSDIRYTPEKWNEIVRLLNEIESEYDKMFFPKQDEEIDAKWKQVREVAIPSFLAYFNQGPLNYEEQTISWVRNLYTDLDGIIEAETGVKTEDFIQFYENIDALIQKKLNGFAVNKGFKEEWLTFTNIQMGVDDNAPDYIKQMGEQRRALYTFMADHGIIYRFKPADITSDDLPIGKVNAILSHLVCKRDESDFLYYTSTRPGNPLYENPIIDIGEGVFQVFEVKQIIHSIDSYLEIVCSKTDDAKDKLIKKKGKLLEEYILNLFKKFFKKDYQFYVGYYVDGCEQDILFLWKNYAFIIEAKGYNLREPFRDPEKAFIRIKDDFDTCIGYGYLQTQRVEQKFNDQVPLKIEDKHGNLIKEIDTTNYENNDYSIIVNLKSFGQVQNDLSTLLEREEVHAFPWVVKLDDLEVMLLTLLAKKKNPKTFVDYLLLRENLHGKLICSDELEVCGGFLSSKITGNKIEKIDKLITTPDLAAIFDDQYRKGIGFKNEKYLAEKKGGKHIFI